MQISVFGIRDVGAAAAACLANEDLDDIALDANPQKVGPLNAIIGPIVESGLDELVQGGIHIRSLKATSGVRRATQDTDQSFVWVETPSYPNGNIDTGYVAAIAGQIGR